MFYLLLDDIYQPALWLPPKRMFNFTLFTYLSCISTLISSNSGANFFLFTVSFPSDSCNFNNSTLSFSLQIAYHCSKDFCVSLEESRNDSRTKKLKVAPSPDTLISNLLYRSVWQHCGYVIHLYYPIVL